MMTDSTVTSGGTAGNWHSVRCGPKFSYKQFDGEPFIHKDTNLVLFMLLVLFGLESVACELSVVMMGFRSPPFLLFLFPLPFAALFAAVATCLALLMAAFLMSLPFIIWWGGGKCK